MPALIYMVITVYRYTNFLPTISFLVTRKAKIAVQMIVIAVPIVVLATDIRKADAISLFSNSCR